MLKQPEAADSASKSAAASRDATPLKLTPRELDVLRELSAGHTNAEIGARLFISVKTASLHVSRILAKLGVTNRVQAALVAERSGLWRDDHSS